MPRTDDDFPRLTSDDLRASRVFTLAVKFFGARRPLSSSEISLDLYPALDASSFRRQYLRDRELLATFGLVIREVASDEAEALWAVDEKASYIEGAPLGADDARTLYVLCHDLVFDSSFAYRDELRMALAKIARICRPTTVPHRDPTSKAEHRILSTLVTAMGLRRPVEVTYSDAHHNTSTRTLSLLGSFGLRKRTYFVACLVDPDGRLVDDSVRTYRLDRFDKVRELRGRTYEIPLDFSVSDYERLPFQMGDLVGTARIELPSELGHEATQATRTYGTVGEGQGARSWSVGYADAEALAAWCVGVGLVPHDPPEVTQHYQQALREAVPCETDPSLASAPSTTTRAPKGAVGRTGSTTVARQLIALAGNLTSDGQALSAHDVADLLGVDVEQARRLIALVCLGSGESIDYLPVITSDSYDELALMEGVETGMRPIRLTWSETVALIAALDELGVRADDPLAHQLTESFATPALSREDIARSLGEAASAELGSLLKTCSHAIAQGMGLAFSYRPVSGAAAARREVMPRLLRRSDDSWYLEAFDLDRQAERVFRVDRMEELREVAPKAVADEPQAPKSERYVAVRFADGRYLDLFHWERLQVLTRTEEGTLARLPDYGGMWLVRHLAACAGTVVVSDPQLARRVEAYVRDLS